MEKRGRECEIASEREGLSGLHRFLRVQSVHVCITACSQEFTSVAIYHLLSFASMYSMYKQCWYVNCVHNTTPNLDDVHHVLAISAMSAYDVYHMFSEYTNTH